MIVTQTKVAVAAGAEKRKTGSKEKVMHSPGLGCREGEGP